MQNKLTASILKFLSTIRTATAFRAAQAGSKPPVKKKLAALFDAQAAKKGKKATLGKAAADAATQPLASRSTDNGDGLGSLDDSGNADQPGTELNMAGSAEGNGSAVAEHSAGALPASKSAGKKPEPTPDVLLMAAAPRADEWPSLSLEWLRAAPDEAARHYLMNLGAGLCTMQRLSGCLLIKLATLHFGCHFRSALGTACESKSRLWSQAVPLILHT